MKLFTGLLLGLMSTSVLAGNSKFVDFAVNQAHKQGFTGCDAAIKRMHEHAGGSDIRVSVTTYRDSPSILTMVSTWGSKGDSVFSKATFVKRGSECLYDNTSILTTTKSCLAYAQEMSAFKYEAETADYIWLQNEGGVKLLLKPLENGCIATFTVDQKA